MNDKMQTYGLMNENDIQEINSTFETEVDGTINVSSVADNAGAASGAAAGLAAL